MLLLSLLLCHLCRYACLYIDVYTYMSIWKGGTDEADLIKLYFSLNRILSPKYWRLSLNVLKGN